MVAPPCLAQDIPELPAKAKLALEEDWSSGKIDPKKWYVLRKKWGQGNHGVVPGNARIGQDTVYRRSRNVLVCTESAPDEG